MTATRCRAWMLTLLCPLVLCATALKAEDAPARKKITKLDDLPKHTYPFKGKPSEFIKSIEQVRELGAKVRKDVEADLAAYDIGDATTLQRMYGTLVNIALVEGRDDDALALIEKIRGLEDKEARKLTTGLTTIAMIDAKRSSGGDDAAYRKAYEKNLAERVAALPWNVVQDEIQQAKGRMEIVSENVLLGAIDARLGPVVESTGELNADQAGGVISTYHLLAERLPLKNETIAAYQKTIDANRVEKKDIWQERSVTLATGEAYKPVLLGVWDSGTDAAIFKDQLFLNPNEHEDGSDEDGNGYIDDVHGIAYDIHAQRTTGTLCSLEDASDRMPQVMKHMKGFMDIQAAIDSPEAAALKKHLAGLEPSQMQGFLEDLSLAGNYAHGTHVAGIMAEGNPFARLLIARHSYDHRMKPVARTMEWAERDAAKCRDTVAYLKQHGVRVVNMSWGEAQEDIEDSLEKNGIGGSAEERRDMARKIFAVQKKGLYDAIAGAPEILFVCAAGNADNDVEFDEYIPSSFDLPNLLVVGAVDQAGEPTSFTSSGKTVQVYGNGFEVDSFVPGGERMKMSGTSMASPNVANLAGKLVAAKPELKPAEVIELIKRGAEKKAMGEQSFLLINPKETLALAKK